MLRQLSALCKQAAVGTTCTNSVCSCASASLREFREQVRRVRTCLGPAFDDRFPSTGASVDRSNGIASTSFPQPTVGPRRRLPPRQALPAAQVETSTGRSSGPVAAPSRLRAAMAAEELVDSTQLFRKCWDKVEATYGDDLIAPREIIWLNGPPGAGKGANNDFIKRIRGMSRSITCSELLLQHSPAKALMDAGALVSDEMVGDALLQAIFDPRDNDGSGLIVDGFPRTPMQVELIKHLYDKLRGLYKRHLDDPERRGQYPRPSFKVVVLYVDEATSIARQMQRSKLALEHNKKVQEAGAGTMKELRGTDCSVEKCKYRYQVFRTHYPALVKLQQVMPFSIIDASGSLEDCEAQIAHELRYQSSLDLDEATYELVTRIPLAREIVQAARQKLVQRLDGYCHRNHQLFRQVIDLIQGQTLPVLRKCSLSGFATFSTKDTTFSNDPLAIDIFIDILTDRGFCVSHVPVEDSIPRRLDFATGDIICDKVVTHRFRITFEKVGVRDVARKAEEASHKAIGAAMHQALLTASVIPAHLDHSLDHDVDEHGFQHSGAYKKWIAESS